MENNRRNFLKKSALLGLAGVAGSLIGKEKLTNLENISAALQETGKFELPKLPYAYYALEPFIDSKTMEIHHSKHHAGYVNNLNKAVETGSFSGKSIEEILRSVNANDAAVRNNAGGHYNHSLFWQLLEPNRYKMLPLPEGTLRDAITTQFNSFGEFKQLFTGKAMSVFGSGWCWLITDAQGNLKITATANQDNPLMQIVAEQGKPVLALDVWEHAYYLKHQNKRMDYISDWWNVINWQKAEELFTQK
ncbi:MAG: superoxide dismutase [Bacteroidetes bacterium]|nr:superoxide dismutase [Bacteroidota bacterium]